MYSMTFLAHFFIVIGVFVFFNNKKNILFLSDRSGVSNGLFYEANKFINIA